MKAKCPYCTKGCGQCDGGFYNVSFAQGTWYTRRCKHCGFGNGVWIREDGTPPPEAANSFPCVDCRSDDVVWEVLGDN